MNFTAGPNSVPNYNAMFAGVAASDSPDMTISLLYKSAEVKMSLMQLSVAFNIKYTVPFSSTTSNKKLD